MPGYLDNYGAGEERRNKLIVRAVLAFVALIVLSLAAYYGLRNRKEKARIETFREILQRQDYKAAYAHWGCTEEKPCPHYSYEKFLEDWGPKSGHTDFAGMQPVRTVTCRDGYGQGWKFGDDVVHLWVVREDQALSYAPWPNWRQTWLAAAFNDCSGMTRTIPTVNPL
jgi:hypothetical protein